MGSLSFPSTPSCFSPITMCSSLGCVSLEMVMINFFERVLKTFTPDLLSLQDHGHHFFIKRLNKGVTISPKLRVMCILVAGMWYTEAGGEGTPEGGSWEGRIPLDCAQSHLSEEAGQTGQTAQRQHLVNRLRPCTPPHGDTQCQSPLLAPRWPKSEWKREDRGRGWDMEGRRLEGRV